MRLDNTYRLAPLTIASRLLSVVLFNCSSTNALVDPLMRPNCPGMR